MKSLVKCKECKYHSYFNLTHWCDEEKHSPKRILSTDFDNDSIMSCSQNEKIKYDNKMEEYKNILIKSLTN